MREVSAAARVRSRRVAEVYRHGTFRDRRPRIQMEYVDGVSLDDEIRRYGVLSVEQALSRIGLALVKAIDEVHQQKIVHRDLKPSNIMIERSGDDSCEIKLLDFGIARIGGGEEKVSSTQENWRGGTPGYWSPEGFAGRAIEYRTDVWGIAIIFFEMLAGELPFGRPVDDESVQTSAAAMMASPPLSLNAVRRSKGIPPVLPAVEELITACLAKRVTERPSIAQLHERLTAIVKEYGKQSGKMNLLLTMRSEALLSNPKRAATQARTSDADAVEAYAAQFAAAPKTAPEAPHARRHGAASRTGGILFVVVSVIVSIFAVALFMTLRRRTQTQPVQLVPTVSPSPNVPEPSQRSEDVSRQTQQRSADTESVPSRVRLEQSEAPTPVPMQRKHKRRVIPVATPTAAQPQQPAHDDNSPVNPFK